MLTPEALLARLEALGIAHHTCTHAPVFTVDEARAVRHALPHTEQGAHLKNLFLRNKKGRMWLLSCLEHRRIDLRRLGERIGAGRLSFASAERLQRHLGVRPGAVTPLAVANDREGLVHLLLDDAVAAYAQVNVHPLVNHMTTTLTWPDLLRFLESVDHPPELIALESLLVAADDAASPR